MASMKSAGLIPLLALLAACQPAATPQAAAPAPTVDLVARGEYLVKTTGCNDCHTPGYAEQQGNVDKAQWLTGSPLGYNGPWGTTYAANLRLTLAGHGRSAMAGIQREPAHPPDHAGLQPCAP